jgi:nucleolin
MEVVEEPAAETNGSSKKRKADVGFNNGDADDASKAAKTNAKIYVKGLPWSATEEEVTDFFKECGTITACELPLGDDGRASGTAFVTFDDEAGATKALEHDNATFGERWLRIVMASEKPAARSYAADPSTKPEGCNTIFIGNLSWNIEEESVREAFAECGAINTVRFATDRETGEFRGFGHVEFEDGEASIDAAMALAGTEICGRPVRVDYAAPRAPREGGFSDGGGRGGGRGGGKLVTK